MLRTLRWATLLTSLLVGGCVCSGGQNGKLVNPSADVSFVSEKGAVIVDGVAGIEVIALNGADKRTLFAERHTIIDRSQDDTLWVANDSETNLLIGRLPGGKWERVAALDGILSTAAISPDGSRIVASRHSDFDVPGSEDDDTLYVIDAESSRVKTIAKSSDSWPTTIRFSADQQAVMLSMAHEKPSQWVELDSGERTVVSEPKRPLYERPQKQPACAEKIVFTKWDHEIKVEDASGKQVVAVREEGRERGFHDYQSDFGQPVLTPGCGYVLFSWERGIWLADAKGSGDVGPLYAGELVSFANTSLLSTP